MPRHGWATSQLREAALDYAVRYLWPVTRGHYRDRFGCSCGNACSPTGTHPVEPDWRTTATDDPETIRHWWGADPYPIIMPTGRRFDVLDVPGGAGRESLVRLEILEYQLGPVAQTEGGRILIWVLPGSRPPVPRAAPWLYEHLDIRYHGDGGYVVAPPCCGVRWLAAPEAVAGQLPGVRDLIGTVVCACRQIQSEHAPPAVPIQRLGNQLEERFA